YAQPLLRSDAWTNVMQITRDPLSIPAIRSLPAELKSKILVLRSAAGQCAKQLFIALPCGSFVRFSYKANAYMNTMVNTFDDVRAIFFFNWRLRTHNERPSVQRHKARTNKWSFSLAFTVPCIIAAGTVLFMGNGEGAQTTLIPADRATVWNPGLNVVGGIPHRATVCATVNASTYGHGAR